MKTVIEYECAPLMIWAENILKKTEYYHEDYYWRLLLLCSWKYSQKKILENILMVATRQNDFLTKYFKYS